VRYDIYIYIYMCVCVCVCVIRRLKVKGSLLNTSATDTKVVNSKQPTQLVPQYGPYRWSFVLQEA
jgi:hypothetical protein